MIEAGAAMVDITPPPGLPMAGFAARTGPATGTHDVLSARALVVNQTALVTADVIGIDAALSARVRSRCGLPAGAVTLAATHTHAGPVSMRARLSAEAEPDYMARLEAALITVIDRAAAARQPARIRGGTGSDPGFARNRRHAGGAVDGGLPVLRIEAADGAQIGVLTSYGCHPVVLGPDNTSWTADYPHFVRAALERSNPGAIAVFATGCCGDVNTGHSAASSLTNTARPERSFDRARAIGEGVAQGVAGAELALLSDAVGAAEERLDLCFEQREAAPPEVLARQWTAEAEDRADIRHIWAKWARTSMGRGQGPLPVRCTAMTWGGAWIIGLPGEIFAETAREIRDALPTDAPLFILAYADDNPGYIPPRRAFKHGGYEVDEAHRFYGMGATFAPGSAEDLAAAGCKAARTAARAASTLRSTELNATEGSMS